MASGPHTPVDYRTVRSILETPILDAKKWNKIPSLPADMILVDLEDSVPPSRKDEARERVVEALSNSEWFGTKKVLARPNHLESEWGLKDVKALAEIGVQCVAYPKIRHIDELHEFVDVLRELGSTADVAAIVETAGAVMALPALARADGVSALLFGPSDLSLDAGFPLYDDNGEMNRVLEVAKSATVFAGAAHGLATSDFAIAPDLRNLDDIKRRVERSRDLGFTSVATFYPPHLDVINAVFTPSQRSLDDASSVVEAYEAALSRGEPALMTENGTAIIRQDYDRARALLARGLVSQAQSG